jgi:hypothetical protein
VVFLLSPGGLPGKGAPRPREGPPGLLKRTQEPRRPCPVLVAELRELIDMPGWVALQRPPVQRAARL